MPLAEATALTSRRPPSHIEEHDPCSDQQALEKVARRCHRFSPLVGCEDMDFPDTLLLDITGVTPLFANEATLIEQIQRSFKRWKLVARIGIGNTIGVAWARTRHVKDADDLDNLSITALRLPELIVHTLFHLGLTQIGDLRPISRQDLQERFGPILLKRFDQFFGDTPEMINPVLPPENFIVEWELDYPLSDEVAIRGIVKHLLERLSFLLSRRARGVLQLECLFKCQQVREIIQVRLFRPSADAKHLQEITQMYLTNIHFPAAVDRVCLRALQHAPLAQHQKELFDVEPNRQDSLQIAALIDRLAGRLGHHAVVQYQLHHEAQPEMSYRVRPIVGKRCPVKYSIRKTNNASGLGLKPLDRPLRLLKDPILLKVLGTAANGLLTRFQYHGCQYQVTHHWGPERIETGWWRKRGICRDYYQVETERGARFWLYRCLAHESWFLHGVFD